MDHILLYYFNLHGNISAYRINKVYILPSVTKNGSCPSAHKTVCHHCPPLEKKGISRIWAILRDFFPARRILRPVCPLRNKGQCVFLKGLHVAQIAL